MRGSSPHSAPRSFRPAWSPSSAGDRPTSSRPDVHPARKRETRHCGVRSALRLGRDGTMVLGRLRTTVGILAAVTTAVAVGEAVRSSGGAGDHLCDRPGGRRRQRPGSAHRRPPLASLDQASRRRLRIIQRRCPEPAPRRGVEPLQLRRRPGQRRHRRLQRHRQRRASRPRPATRLRPPGVLVERQPTTSSGEPTTSLCRFRQSGRRASPYDETSVRGHGRINAPERKR
jgi:hypothetical protein